MHPRKSLQYGSGLKQYIFKLIFFFIILNKRIIATTILSVINILGVGVGFLIPGGFVEDNIKGEEAKSQIFNLVLAEAIMTTVATIPVFILFKEKPPTPPR